MAIAEILPEHPDLGFVKVLEAPKHIDHLPVVLHFMRKLGVASIIDEAVGTHPDREISVGRCVEALILSILSGSHSLYRVSDVLAPWDLDLVFGQGTAVDADDFNDNRLGRAMDQLFKANLSALQSQFMVAAIRNYELDTRFMHGDLTNVQVFGQYADSVPSTAGDFGAAPHLDFGHPKQGRSDLKQFLFGLVVSCSDYVPLLGWATDGNRSENVENRFNLTRLANILPNPSDTVLVGDSKLFSGENMALANRHGMSLLTLLPKNTHAWSEVFEQVKDQLEDAPILRQRVFRPVEDSSENKEQEESDESEEDNQGCEIEFKGLAEQSAGRVLDTWRGMSVPATHNFKESSAIAAGDEAKAKEKKRLPDKQVGLRALAIMSTTLKKTKAKTLERQVNQELKKLEVLNKRFAIAKNRFSCQQDAEAAAKEALKDKQRFHDSTISTVVEEHTEKRQGPGRPSNAATAPVTKSYYRVCLEHVPCESRQNEWLLRESVFILVIGKEADEQRFSDADLLEAYKGQQGVEGAFKVFKGPLEVAPIFLESPKRIASLAFVYVLALMVHAQVQRQLRQALAEHNETIAGNRGQTNKPTMEVLRRLLSGIVSQRFETQDGRQIKHISNLTTEQVKAFTLLGIEFWRGEGVVVTINEPRRGQKGYKPKGNGLWNCPKRLERKEMLRQQRLEKRIERPGKSKYKV